MDALLETGLATAMKNTIGKDLFGTKEEAEKVASNKGAVASMTVSTLFNQFYQHVVVEQGKAKNYVVEAKPKPKPRAPSTLSKMMQALTLAKPLQARTEPDEGMPIFVKDLTGKTITVYLPETDAVDQLRARICVKTGIPVEQQRIIYDGRQLHVGTLKENGFKRECTVHLVLTLRGGGFAFYFTDPQFFDSDFDFDFSDNKIDSDTYYRGGKQYNRPLGSKRYAIRVVGMYSDDTWLGEAGNRTDSTPGEWPVAYHGTKESNCRSIVSNGFDLSKGRRFKYGKGIYCTPDPQVAKAYGHEFTFKGRSYRLVFQTRVNPLVMQVVEMDASYKGVRGQYWLVPSGEHIRPYGVCVFPVDSKN